MIKSIFAAAVIGAACMGAQASSNLVLNGGMNGTTGSYVYNAAPPSVNVGIPKKAGTVADWTGSFVSIASNSSAWGNPSSLKGFSPATQGSFIAGVQADGTLSQALTLGESEYSLSWLTANRGSFGSNQTYSVYFDGTLLDTVTTVRGAGWTMETVTFTSLTGGTGLSFVGDTKYNKTDATSFIDNVSVSVVPEPTALLMMAFGTLGLLAWRRRASL